MNVTPFPVVHIHVPTWACVVALLLLAAALAWDVLGTQVVRDQVEQAADDANRANSAAAEALARVKFLEGLITDETPSGRHTAAKRPVPFRRAA